LHETLGYMSIPGRLVSAIKNKSEELLKENEMEKAAILQQKKREYDAAYKNLMSVEEKWINNQLSFETYQRWLSNLSTDKIKLKSEIEQLSQDQGQLQMLLNKNLAQLTDMQTLYSAASITNKQELLRKVFDDTLYYEKSIYRTQYIMPVFSHNTLILKQKQLLIIDDINANRPEGPFMWR